MVKTNTSVHTTRTILPQTSPMFASISSMGETMELEADISLKIVEVHMLVKRVVTGFGPEHVEQLVQYIYGVRLHQSKSRGQ